MQPTPSTDAMAVDYVFLPRDWLTLAFCRHGQTYMRIRAAIIALFLVLVLCQLAVGAPSFALPLLGLVVPFLICPMLIFHSIAMYVIWRCRSPVRVLINANGITVEQKGKSHHTPWYSFAIGGGATEYKTFIYLDSGRQPCWIPKRAFRHESDLEWFRQFASKNLGGRYKLNYASVASMA